MVQHIHVLGPWGAPGACAVQQLVGEGLAQAPGSPGVLQVGQPGLAVFSGSDASSVIKIRRVSQSFKGGVAIPGFFPGSLLAEEQHSEES